MGVSVMDALTHRIASLGGKCTVCDAFVLDTPSAHGRDKCAYCESLQCESCRKVCSICNDAVCELCEMDEARMAECVVCGEDRCAECLGTCELCEERICIECKLNCSACGVFLCSECVHWRSVTCCSCDTSVCEDCAREWLDQAPQREDEGRDYEEYVCDACRYGNGARHYH
jgi:hypothetical protein